MKAVFLALLVALTPWYSFGQTCPAFLDTEVRLLHSNKEISLCQLAAGRPLLIVNTASRCGFTPQFHGLEALHQQYHDQGLVVIGFPSNDFRQEAPSEAETAKVCYANFGVTFTMSAPVRVIGGDAHPLFLFLGERAGQPEWNFYKYLISPDGEQVIRLPSRVQPQSPEMERALKLVL